MFFNGFGQFNFGWMNFRFMPYYNSFSFNTPQFPFFQPQMFNFTPNWNIGFDTFTYTTKSTNSDSYELSNYNSTKGNLLANIALNRAPGEIGYCAKYVQEAINLAGLGGQTRANANQMANILRENPNFKEISTENTNVNSLPAGCVLVYDSYVRNDEETYGHTEFTTGDGHGVSDGITDTLNPNPSSIFIPV